VFSVLRRLGHKKCFYYPALIYYLNRTPLLK
jgi:hypothetical protein